MKKSILALLLAVLMVASLLPFGALADGTWTEVDSANALTTALQNSGNIKLTADISVATKQNWRVEKDVVLDLNNFDIVSSYGENNNFLFTVSGASFTVTDNSEDKTGTIEATDSSYGYGIQLKGTNSSFTFLGGTIKTTQETVDIYNSAKNASITISGGKLISTADNVLGVRGSGTVVDINGGEMDANGRTGVYISCYGDPDSIKFNMTGGTLTHTGGASGAIQMYNGATLTFGGDAKITSSSYAVQVQENTILNVTGGTLETTGTYAISAGETSSINISGGTISSTKSSGYALRAEDNSVVEISGGNIESKIKKDGGSITVTGGTINDDVADYLPKDSVLIQGEDGKVIVDETKTAVVAINGVGFTSMGAAIKAVGDGGTITVLQNITNAVGIAVDSGKNFTIDFAENEYILVGPGAGSSGTETNGFQLLKDSTIVFKNGRIRIAENATGISRIIQNYANLTLENMDIYAENQAGGEDYALSFNNGTITFKGDTNIYTSDPENTTVFDVYYWAGSYEDGVTVTFDNTFVGTIEGTILYDSTNKEKARLEINGAGVFQNIETSDNSTKDPDIEVNGGSFVTPVNNEYLSGNFKYRAYDGQYYTYHKTLDEAVTAAGTNGTVDAVATEGKVVYTVKTVYGNGASDNVSTYFENDVITLPAKPYKSGYAFLGWSDGTTTYSALSPYTVTKDVIFTASWVRHPDTPYVPEPEEPEEPEVPAFPFYDVPTSAWYYTAVKYVYDNKLMDGVDTYVFAPNDTLTRAMVWTIIARMSGVDTTGGANWYAKAQEWVVVNGISDGENPTAAITRQELVTMLYRYAQIKGYDVSVGESTNILSYVDATSISEYAMSAFQWACGSGLTEGDENGALTPLATATRAQAAAMIMRFLSK